MWGAIAGAAAAIGGSIFQGIKGAEAQKESNETNLAIARMNNEYNERLQGQQNAYNLDMWKQQNAYNTPTAQLNRYKAAGLNPNLIYGNGSASAGNADAIKTESPKPAQDVRVAPVNYYQGLAQGLQNGFSTVLQALQLQNQTTRYENQNKVSQSQVDLNRIGTQFKAAQTLTEGKRYDLVNSQVENVRVSTLYNSFRAETARNFSEISSKIYNVQLEAAMAARELSAARTEEIANKIALAWKQYDLSVKKTHVDISVQVARKEQIIQAIENLKLGADLKEIQKSLMGTDNDFRTAEKVTSILGNVLGGLAKFK